MKAVFGTVSAQPKRVLITMSPQPIVQSLDGDSPQDQVTIVGGQT